MVSPINGDKPLSTTTERTGESTKNSRSEQPAIAASNSLEEKAAKPVDATLEVNKARQLYDLETRKSQASSPDISTPEAARSLLNEILEQFSAKPEQAMKSQASEGTALVNLLQTTPA